MATREVNFDGIVGPTHNYAGLSYGNIASTSHESETSSPRQAALQGLAKMKFVHDQGIAQAVLPPLRRPQLDLLRAIGFAGSDAEVIESASKSDPGLLASCFSASNMWTANAATVSPSMDCRDGRLHLTPANLASGLHRSIEAPETTAVLRAIFADQERFVVHDPLPSTAALSDEGAANHTRLSAQHGDRGVELFVYGRSALDKSHPRPTRYPARQTLEASEAVIRLHGLDPSFVVAIQQSPVAIDSGVFHNDVISVGNQNFLLYHENAFVDPELVVASIRRAIDAAGGWKWHSLRLDNDELPLADAVKSYLFNSQLLTRPDGSMTLLCPIDARENPAAHQCTEKILAEDNPVDQVEFLDLRQSMNNGGGPACLRLRVVMTDEEMKRVHQSVLFSDSLYTQLTDWVKNYYRDELTTDDLHDPQLRIEIDAAFMELSSILKLPREVFRL